MIERVLCVDPSFSPGWVVLEFTPSSKELSILAHGYSDFNKCKNPYRELASLIQHVCSEYQITHYLGERQFFKSMFEIVGACFSGVAEGVVVLNRTQMSKDTLSRATVNVKKFEFDYKSIRKILFNNTKLTKEETKSVLSCYYSVQDWTLDEVDALALGLAYVRLKYELILDGDQFV